MGVQISKRQANLQQHPIGVELSLAIKELFQWPMEQSFVSYQQLGGRRHGYSKFPLEETLEDPRCQDRTDGFLLFRYFLPCSLFALFAAYAVTEIAFDSLFQ